MKKLLCLVFVATLLFAGCSQLQEEETIVYTEPLPMQELDLEPGITINPLLYFLNESQTRLMAETRELYIPQNERKEWHVVQALLDGPLSGNLTPVAEGFVLENIEVMPDVVNVHLTLEGRKTDDEIFNAKAAIAATLSDFSGKKYINVLINGMQDAYMDMPIGVMQKLSTDLYEERTVLQGRSETVNPDMQAVLYYLDSSEKYLLPEVRRLVFKNNEYVETLVDQLIRGPEDSFNHRAVLDSKLRLLKHQWVKDESGHNILRLHFNKDPVAFTDSFVDGKKMALAALNYTITSFVPDVYGIEIVVGTMQAPEPVSRAKDYSDMIGSSVTVYLPGSNISPTLVGMSRVVPQNVAYDPSTVLSQLMMGPNEMEKEVYPAMPDGISIQDVKDIYMANDILVVDLKRSVNDIMKTLSDDKAFLMIYATVNTLTSIEGVRRVQFLLEGERVNYLGNGAIHVIDPLIKNPGIIRS